MTIGCKTIQSLKTSQNMYTATKSSAVPEVTASQPTTAETLTYWTDSRSAMARPNPSVSNCGLVIVQVQPEVPQQQRINNYTGLA